MLSHETNIVRHVTYSGTERPSVSIPICFKKIIINEPSYHVHMVTPILVHRFAGEAHGTRHDEQRNSLDLDK